MRRRRGGGELLIVAIVIIAFGLFLLSPIATLIGFISLVIGGVLAAFAILLERKGRLHDRPGIWKQRFDFAGKSPVVPFLQFRFVIEQIDAGRTSIHEQPNH